MSTRIARPALVISAYNRPGALIHEFHSTVSLIRTFELCLGIEPMNFLDANATPHGYICQ